MSCRENGHEDNHRWLKSAVQLVRFLLLSSSGIEGKEHYIKDAYWCEKTTLFPATTITLLRWVCGRVTLSRFGRATWIGRRV